jgi:Helicase HerA, central domain
MDNYYEKLGAFYLGKEYDLASRTLKENIILYDSKDLNTHAVIIGMTGSGKTGLGISLLEEALIDKIPVIAIDPKGDLPNLLLNFPELKPQDFRPWINEQDALNKGLTPEKYAAGQAQLWKKGLASWDQAPERIARLRSAAQFAVYTPGSSAGLPVSVLRNFAPPPAAIMEDTDLFRERIQTTATGLLALLGIEADPVNSREHILLANLFENSWKQGRALDLAGLINSVQKPPFERIGVMDLEFFYPAKDRLTLAMRMNNLLAAPGFESWMEGEPLDIGRLFYGSQGKPRASIFTISHLSDVQRMFFVSMLLNELLGWMRTQPGTSSLRAILYMDEIFGYLPPIKNPPSKTPLLTLLKQARAFGLGLVLSTQNPVDLDYKALSNTGTWFIGRLQTERDKQRVLEGLEGAAAGTGFERNRMEEILAGLGQRVFLLHNVHENEPVTFQTRWVLSYLRGPMTREHIKVLTAEMKDEISSPGGKTPLSETPVSMKMSKSFQGAMEPPPGPPGLDTFYLGASGAGRGLVYYPAVIGRMDVHFSNARYKVDRTETLAFLSELGDGPVTLDWDNAVQFDPNNIETSPLSGADYNDLPATAKKATAYRKWNKDLLRWVRQHQQLILFRSKRFRMTSRVAESEGEFRGRLSQTVREKRDLEVEKIRRKYSSRFTTLRSRLMRAQQAIERETEQSRSKKIQTAVSFGTAILGAFLGRKAVSAGSASRLGTAMRSASRMRKEKMDVARAHEKAASVEAQLLDMEARMQADIEKIEISFDPEFEELEEIRVKPKTRDITLEIFGPAWIPFRREAEGQLTPDWS